MSNFNLNSLYLRLLRIYNEGLICYEKYVVKPCNSVYDRMYKNSIISIRYLNTFDMVKRTEFAKTQTDLIRDIYLYIYGQEVQKCVKLDFHSSGQTTLDEGSPIYDITCWDNKRYLSRNSFNVHNRAISKRRHIVLHASINDVHDITIFVNTFPTSFTIENNIKIVDIMSILLMDKQITFDDFYKFIDGKDNFLYTIDDDTLEVRTFKDNDIIVL